MQPHTVLILDDNETSREVLEYVLSGAGYRTLLAANATNAIRVCKEYKGRLGVLVTEVLLNGISGSAVAQQARELDPNISVVFLSGYPIEHLIVRGFLDQEQIRASNTVFLQKPFTARTLRQAVQTVQQQSRAE